jgi:hypothetical protein
MTRPFTPTPEQKSAADFLEMMFGRSTIEPTTLHARNGRVKVCGIDASGVTRAKWHVDPDGRVPYAYDPGGGIAGYVTRVMV